MSAQLSDSAETARLLAQAASDQQSALAGLLKHHRQYLRRIVELRFDNRLRARIDPSDVVQETQMEAHRRFADYLRRRPMPFKLWLRKTAQQRLCDLQREHLVAQNRSVGREKPQPDHSSLMLAAPLAGRGPSPSEQVARRDFEQQVALVVGELSENDRDVLLMRHVEGLSHQEIACLLDVDAAAARKRYGRALLRLRKLLVDRGLAEEDA